MLRAGISAAFRALRRGILAICGSVSFAALSEPRQTVAVGTAKGARLLSSPDRHGIMTRSRAMDDTPNLGGLHAVPSASAQAGVGADG